MLVSPAEFSVTSFWVNMMVVGLETFYSGVSQPVGMRTLKVLELVVPGGTRRTPVHLPPGSETSDVTQRTAEGGLALSFKQRLKACFCTLRKALPSTLSFLLMFVMLWLTFQS